MPIELEIKLISAYKEDLIRYMRNNRSLFPELVMMAAGNDPRCAWRAAWLLWSVMERNDKRLMPYTDLLIASLRHRPGNQQRELIKVLTMLELSGAQQGILYQTAVEIWEHRSNKPSLRYCAFRLATEIAARHPQLLLELEMLTDDSYLEELSETVKRAVRKLFMDTKKSKSNYLLDF